MTRTKSTYLALLAVMLAPMAAQATPIMGGTGVVGASDDIDFSEIALGDFVLLTNQYNSLGVDFSGAWYNGCTACVFAQPDGIHPEVANFNNNNTAVWAAVTTLMFTGNVSDLSFAFASNGGTFVLESFLNGGLVESFNFNGSIWQNYGFANSFFDEIRITSASAMIFDNLRFNSVPEPGALALLGIGLFGMGLARRRKKV